MKTESVVFAIGGMVFGLLVGWIIGDQQAKHSGAIPVAAAVPSAPPSDQPRQPPPFDDAKAQTLIKAADGDPKNVQARIELGNMYHDAERFPDAIKWYEQALALDPKNVNVSTDLGVSYYSSNQPDKALKQFEHSLSVDPTHSKTLLNQGIVRWFGKQDAAGAIQSWQKLVDTSPNSEEARIAQQGLTRLKERQAGAGSTPGS